jgi:hypothetical protein
MEDEDEHARIAAEDLAERPQDYPDTDNTDPPRRNQRHERYRGQNDDEEDEVPLIRSRRKWRRKHMKMMRQTSVVDFYHERDHKDENDNDNDHENDVMDVGRVKINRHMMKPFMNDSHDSIMVTIKKTKTR